jgi:hypothetical protein
MGFYHLMVWIFQPPFMTPEGIGLEFWGGKLILKMIGISKSLSRFGATFSKELYLMFT